MGLTFEILKNIALTVGWVGSIYYYFKYTTFRIIECEKEIALLKLELEPLTEKRPRLESFLRAKHSFEGIQGPYEDKIRKSKLKEADKEVEKIKIKIRYYEDIKSRFFDIGI